MTWVLINEAGNYLGWHNGEGRKSDEYFPTEAPSEIKFFPQKTDAEWFLKDWIPFFEIEGEWFLAQIEISVMHVVKGNLRRTGSAV